MQDQVLRNEIIEIARAMNSRGINQGTSGNISARCADGFLITPSNVDYDDCAPEDIIHMAMDGTAEGPHKPSSEWRIHRDLLAERPEIHAVLHAHPTFSTTLACLRRPIPPFHYMVAVAGGKDIRCAPYSTFGTEALSEAAISAMKDRTACLLANHGMLAVGRTLKGTLARAVEVEALARQYLQALQIGEPVLLDDSEMDDVLVKFAAYKSDIDSNGNADSDPSPAAAPEPMPPVSINSTMQAAILTGPEAIDVKQVPVPEPGEGEILLGVQAATTCGTDVKVFRRGGHPRMLKVPTLFGHEVSGRIAAVGPGVSEFAIGDAVVVANSAPCMNCDACHQGRENLCEDLHYINGAFAEYLLVPKRFVQRNTYRIPAGLGFERAALAEPLGCVLHGISACELERYGRRGPVEIIVLGGGPIGLLFVAALAKEGHRVILADPNLNRLEVGRKMGAAATVRINRGGGQAERLKAETKDKKGAWIAIESTGVTEAWLDAIQAVRPGGLVNLFGGCAPGTMVELDTHLVHYSELTIKGVYHHRPATIRKALALLADPAFKADYLLSAERPIDEIEDALRSMMRKDTLKVVMRTGNEQAAVA